MNIVVCMKQVPATGVERKLASDGTVDRASAQDDALAGSDALATSPVLAEALKQTGFDMVLFGSESTDARTGLVPAMVADVSIDPAQVGLGSAASWVEDFAVKPPRAAGVTLKDEGDGGTRRQDAEAPNFEVADLFTVVPQLIEDINKRH
jgi:electron transfer flavoprotein alpha/beta subunit